MQLLDGKTLATKILDQLKPEISSLGRIRLGIVVVGKNPVIEQFVAIKKKKAESIGAEVRIYDDFEPSISTTALRERMKDIVHEKENDGIIVQIPLPDTLDLQAILNSVTPEKDVDVLSARAVGNFIVGKSIVTPPVVGAIKELIQAYEITMGDKYVVVVGGGKLVGAPVIEWLLQEKITYTHIRKETKNPERFLKEADVIISGVGIPKLIRGDAVKEGVVIFDAGTSNSEGATVGDIDFDSVSPKASFITPVPGGIGPLTVAVLLRNLVLLAKKQRE